MVTNHQGRVKKAWISQQGLDVLIDQLVHALMRYPVDSRFRFLMGQKEVVEAWHRWSLKPAVKALGAGIDMNRPVINVYLDYPNFDLQVPNQIEIEPFGRIPIVVNPFCPTVSQSFTFRQRPIQPGFSISHWNHKAGTATAIVERTVTDGSEHKFLLSCEHVLYSNFNGDADRIIVQPAVEDTIDDLDNRVALQFKAGGVDQNGVNTIDAAIARLRPGVAMTNAIPATNRILRDISNQIYSGQSLVMYGRTSGESFGTVIESTANTQIGYEIQPTVETSIRYRDLVKCHFPNNAGGDSGAPVLDANTGELVGLHMSGNPDTDTTYFCKIKNVFNELFVQLALE